MMDAIARIRDYLHTQGLRLSVDEVAVSMLAAQTVLAMGEGEVDADMLWHADGVQALPAQCLPEPLLRLRDRRQLRLALDATLSRSSAMACAVYWCRSSSDDLSSLQIPSLLRLLSLGAALPAGSALDENTSRQFLPCRTAQTAWLTVVDNVATWLADGSLSGAQSGASQLAVPVCDAEGSVVAVVFVVAAHAGAFDDAAIAPWVGLALALDPFLRDWLDSGETHTTQIEKKP